MSELATTDRMTADAFYEWCQLPENAERRCELIRGEIIDMPRPSIWHGIICGWIAQLLNNYADQRGSGVASSNDAGLTISEDTVLGPDVMYFVMEPNPEQAMDRHARMIPTLCVEVLSPSNKPTEMLQKVSDYFRVGVELVWVVDPEFRAVQVYQRTEFPKVLDETETLTGNGILPELAIPVARLFSKQRR